MAGLCLATAPNCQAASLNFTTGDKDTNPFFYNIDDDLSSWKLVSGGTINPAIVDLLSSDSIEFISSGASIDTFTSGEADQLYNGSFTFTYDPETIGENDSFYQICSTSTCSGATPVPLGASSIDPIPFTLESGQYLRFGIDNTDSPGDLTITNFSATPVPSPLPFAGLGLAALGIYRARRRKAATPK